MPGVVYLSELIKFPWYRHVPISDISKDSGHSLQSRKRILLTSHRPSVESQRGKCFHLSLWQRVDPQLGSGIIPISPVRKQIQKD